MSMEQVKLLIKKLDPERDRDIPLPQYATVYSAGMDIAVNIQEPQTLGRGERKLLPTGLAAAIPAGYEMQVRPRSGLAVKHGITLANSPGTIDSDYRGEIKVCVINLGEKPFTIHRGDRVAQLVVAPVVKCSLQQVSILDDTERGSGGFGHTGM